jgi:transposase
MGLYLRWQPRNFQAVDVADFPRALWRHRRGSLLLWDRGSIHRGLVIDAVRQLPPRRHVEEFPAYAPELNPAEQIWNDFKNHTATSLLRDTREIGRSVRANTRRVCRSQATLRSFILAADLPAPPWPQYHC